MSILIVRYSEIGLKSTPIRKRFENQLKDNILTMLMEDGVEAIVTKNYSLPRMSAGQSFAVKARREGSQGYTSMDVGREAGSAIFIANEDKGVRVDLTDPDVVFYVEVRENRAFVFSDYIRCHAGLPVGSQGKVLARVDDDRGLVAAWLMMKRGCRLTVHGDGDLDALRRYDPLMKVGDGNPHALGYVLGTSVDGLGSVDVTSYDVPVFFPTIGMTDGEVSEIADTIRAGL